MKDRHDSVVLRTQVRPDDVVHVRKITGSSGYFRPDEVEVAASLVLEYLEKGIQSGYYFVFAEVEQATIAYCCFGPIPCTLGSYDLYWIAVDVFMKRSGIGKMLLAKAEEMAAQMGARQMYIETSAKQQYEDTRVFYEKSGYAIASVLHDFYSPGDHKVTYVKLIN